jgi:hypothetical protein
MSIGLEQWLGINFSIQYFFAIFCLAYFRFRSVLPTKGKFWNNIFSSAKRRRALILLAQRGSWAYRQSGPNSQIILHIFLYSPRFTY